MAALQRTLTRAATRAATLLAGALAVVALLALVVAAGGYEAGPALVALWRGSFGSTGAFVSATLVRATPLVLTGLAVTLAFRAGVWNIGAEGQLLAGAATAAAIALAIPAGDAAAALAVPVVLLGAALAGGAWAGIAALLRRRHGVPEVISTIMLNFVAASLVGWLVRGPLQEPLGIYPQSDAVPAAARLPFFPGTRLHAGAVVALLAAAHLAWLLRATAAGFRVRAAGANPDAARTAGRIDVARTTMLAFLASGALAGLAGAVEVTGVTYALYENLSPGYGFTAIAVALLARLDPALVVGSGILFGALEAGGAAMQRDAGVPAVLVEVVEALIILGVLAIGRLRARRAAAEERAGDDGADPVPLAGAATGRA
jgi:simple sugar transport system permease protein